MLPLSETGLFTPRQIDILKKRSIRSIRDLLFYFPRRYVDMTFRFDIGKTRAGDQVTFVGKVRKAEVAYGRKRRLVVAVDYHTIAVQLTFFSAIPYYRKLLTPGVEAAFSGKLDLFRNSLSILHPEVEIMSGDDLVHTGKIVPIYKITDMMRQNYISTKTLRKNIYELLKLYESRIVDPLADYLPSGLQNLSISRALRLIHFPDSMDDVELSKSRLAFDELIIFAVLMFHKREKRMALEKSAALQEKESQWVPAVLNNLPFELTGAQKRAIDRLRFLAHQNHPFGALLQGDVGAGKTLVALLCALEYLEQGIQVAVMAPTGILASQHYKNFINYLSSVPMLQMDLLTGSEKVSAKKEKLERIRRGDTLFAVGTHALIQEGVEFDNLGLVIIDEQHRFGVEQREALRSKGKMPDLLAMSATPIPRSLTLTLYGDLEPLIISEKPPGRQKIETKLFDDKDLPLLYEGIKKYVNQGRQAYIVYPVIEESDKVAWSSVLADFHILEKEVFPGYRLGILHGKLSSDEKERAMEKFKSGQIQILATTTVIEVGVDVPNATVMMIRNAEKFGLSQLHQLRGRVGRGSHQSFCILVHSENVSDEGEQRLAAMVESDDGFYLAQKDFEIRGSGELLSTKQSGISEFKIADLRYHTDLAAKARAIVDENSELRKTIMEVKGWEKLFSKGFILFSN